MLRDMAGHSVCGARTLAPRCAVSRGTCVDPKSVLYSYDPARGTERHHEVLRTAGGRGSGAGEGPAPPEAGQRATATGRWSAGRRSVSVAGFANPPHEAR